MDYPEGKEDDQSLSIPKYVLSFIHYVKRNEFQMRYRYPRDLSEICRERTSEF